MSDMFTKKEINEIRFGYDQYIKHKQLGRGTYAQYTSIVKDYLRSVVINKINIGEYKTIFSEENIETFRIRRKSSIVKAALNNLLNYFISEQLIEKGFEFAFQISEPLNRQTDFLTVDQIKYIFYDAQYKNKNEAMLVKAICALTAFCFFEQKHINSLSIQDVDLDEDYIKNLRATKSDDTSHLTQFISFNSLTKECLKDYIENYRNKLDIKYNEFFILDGLPIGFDQNGVNKSIKPLKRVANTKILSENFNIQDLLASSILLQLVASKGNSLYNIAQIVEDKNEQYKKALRYYMQNYSEICINSGTVKIEEFDLIERGFRLAEETLINPTSVQELYTNSDFNVFEKLSKYSEEDDINMDDLVNFDSINKQNLDSREVKIERLIRDTKIASELKSLYNNKCQLCGFQLRSATDDYMSEAHHIKPYNNTHQGDDTYKNLIVLCPNCHAQFDQLLYAINPDTHVVHCLYNDDQYHLSELEMKDGHELGKDYLEYIWYIFFQKKNEIIGKI